MNANTSNISAKVVSINAGGRERSPGQRIISECTDHLDDALCEWLGEIRAPIAEELFVLADGTRERLLQTRYLDLRQEVERHWPRMTEAFRRSFADSGRPAAPHASTLDDAAFDSLNLVDDEELSERIVVREFAA